MIIKETSNLLETINPIETQPIIENISFSGTMGSETYFNIL